MCNLAWMKYKEFIFIICPHKRVAVYAIIAIAWFVLSRTYCISSPISYSGTQRYNRFVMSSLLPPPWEGFEDEERRGRRRTRYGSTPPRSPPRSTPPRPPPRSPSPARSRSRSRSSSRRAGYRWARSFFEDWMGRRRAPDDSPPPPRSPSPLRSRSSSRRSPRRPSNELTAAEKSARAREKKEKKEIEEARLASMDPKTRATYNEKKRLRLKRRINEMKSKFAKEIDETAQKQAEKFDELNRSWKRKHDDDSATQAAERRQIFVDTRRRYGPPPLTEAEREAQFDDRLQLILKYATRPITPEMVREANKNHAVELLEKIYVDLQYHFLHPTLINSDKYDPYVEMFYRPQHVSFRRFRELLANPVDGFDGIGIGSTAVLMLSETFRTALRYGENSDGSLAKEGDERFPLVARWEEFNIKLRVEHVSIRGFAVARHIPYMTVFRRMAQKTLGLQDLVDDENIQLSPSIRDPYEVYLSSDGSLLPCLFTPLPGDSDSVRHRGAVVLPFNKMEDNLAMKAHHQRAGPLPFQNLKDNIYNREIFKDYDPPLSWPPSWEYPPADIQHPCREWGKDYPLCVACGLRSGPLDAPLEAGPEANPDADVELDEDEDEDADTSKRTKICQCKTSTILDKVLVEIREFSNASTTSKGVDRGIRTLQKIRKGHIIGEILGEFIPLAAELDFKCPTKFSIDFNGPPKVDEDGNPLEIDPDVIARKPIDTNTDPIATLIMGHKGGWTRCLNCGTSRTANIEARSEVWARKLRITVRALREINFGEQLLSMISPKSKPMPTCHACSLTSPFGSLTRLLSFFF